VSRHAAETPDLAARMARQFVRHALDLRFPRLEDAAEAAAYRMLADAEIADGLRATRTLAALDARHQPRLWRGSSTGYVCTCGQGAYPCPDRRVLDGAEQPAAVPA
jgi:hypothetical protein